MLILFTSVEDVIAKEEQLISNTLLELASRIRQDDVIAIALCVMDLDDVDIDRIKHDNPKDFDRKFAIFMKWKRNTGAGMKDIKDLFRKARVEGISVTADVYDLLGIGFKGNNIIS